MSLRFRKSIKLAPGIRMNLGSGGVSWSLGPRGASIGIGKRGTYLNAGIPGTGLSYRTRLDTPGRIVSAPSASTNVQVTVAVRDDGTIHFKDHAGNPVPDAWITQAKRQQGDKIRQLIRDKCDEINAQVEALGEIHLYTPAPNVAPNFARRPFDVAAPAPPSLRPRGLLAWIFKRVARRIEAENAARTAAHALAHDQWETARQGHDAAQTVLKQSYFGAVAGVPGDMEMLLEQNLHEITWPCETNISIQISADGGLVMLDVDLPEIEQLPNKFATVPQGGYSLSVKAMGETNRRKLYMRHVHAIGFRLMGEVFAALPTVRETIVSGYSQRTSGMTAQIADEYLYSVRATRNGWSAINFSNLGAIDVVDAFTAFDLRRSMSKTGVFSMVSPFPAR